MLPSIVVKVYRIAPSFLRIVSGIISGFKTVQSMYHIYNVPPVVNNESRFKEILKNLPKKS